MHDVININVDNRKAKATTFLELKFSFETAENILCNNKIKNFIIVLFLFFLTNIFAQKKEISSSKNIDFNSIKNLDSINKFTDFEIQKLKTYRLKTAHIKNKEKYVNQIHTFTKDSLQILAVKLLSIKELEAKKLLDLDIDKHRGFYISLLKELKQSDIAPNEYLFLENKLSKFLINEIETKYTYSKWLNIILGISLIILLIFLLNTKCNKEIVTELSKQEATIKNLILKGKSNKEIAEELFISLSTVKTHITNIYKKLNISNRDELNSKFKNTTSTST